MASKNTGSNSKALVTVFDDVETARLAVEKLNAEGFPTEKIELVTQSVQTEAPEVTTPRVHDTTATSMVESATKWSGFGGGIGAVGGLLAAVLSPFPGVGLGMIFMGGLTGAMMGGIAGLQHASEDDSVDLPTLKEYERLIKNGDSLVVVLGNHDEVMRAEAIIKDAYELHSHVHKLHGHEFHEHPSRETD